MTLPLAQQKTIEVVHTGEIDAGGSNSEKAVNVYHYRRTAVVLPITKSQVFNAWKAAIGDKVILALNARYTSSKVQIRIIDDKEDAYSEHAFTDPGAIAGDSLPSHICGVMLLKSGIRGRYANGRKFYAPISEASIGDDVLNAAALTLFGTVATGILAGFTDAAGNVWKSVVCSKSHGDMTAVPAVYWTYDITSVAVKQRLGQLKGRRVRSV